MAPTWIALLNAFILLTMSTLILSKHVPSPVERNGCNCSAINISNRYTDLCPRGYTYRCNGAALDRIPDTFPEWNASNPLCVFELSNSNITELRNESFLGMRRHLNDVRVVLLTENRISYIDADAFRGLNNIRILNLTSNYITNTSFMDDVFEPLTGLTTLSIKSNNFSSFFGLDVQFSHLTNIERLYIDGCRGCVLGPQMQNLNKLRVLSFSGRESNSCNLGNMCANMFENVKSISHLYVSSCNIEAHVNNSTFKPLTNLQLLDISYNEKLSFEGMNRCLCGLNGSSTLYELNVNHIYEWYERGTMLKVKHVEYLKTLKNLTVLHMDLNKLEVFESDILQNNLVPSSLRTVTLTGNRLTYGNYTDNMFMASNITRLDISRQHLNYDPFIHEHSDNFNNNDHINNYIGNNDNNKLMSNAGGNYTCSSVIDKCRTRQGVDVFITPKDLQVWKWRKSFLFFKILNVTLVHALSTKEGFKCAIGSPNLKHLDFSFNLIYSWQGPVCGVSNITHLDLSENYCKNVSMHFFDSFTGLEWLNVSGNFLGHVIKHNTSTSYQMFKHLTKLQLLDLSTNKIGKLDVKIFQNLTALRHLNLSGNMLEDWKPNLDNSQCLSRIDLSLNKLTTIPESLRSHLDWVVDNQATQCNWTGNILINLSGNPIDCSCDAIPFLKWMDKTVVQVAFLKEDSCHLPGGAEWHFRDNYTVSRLIETLEKECVSYTTFIIICVVISTSFVTIVACVVVYSNRWRLRHWYYSKNRRHRHNGFDRLFENDAFISYAKDDALFIKSKLVPALEEVHKLKVWVADRNSFPGASIAENVVHAISSSRKSVMLINRKYLHENWCDYELNMARVESIETKRKLIIFVLYEDIPTVELPITILRSLRSEASLEYPKHPQHLEAFWAELAGAVVNDDD